MKIRRIFVEKKPGFDIEAKALISSLKELLSINKIENIRVLYRYDIEGLSDEIYSQALKTVFSEAPVDLLYEEKIEVSSNSRIFAIEYLPGQYDQRADSASQCIQILTHKDRPNVKYAKIIIVEGKISDAEFLKIKNYMINPVDSREASLQKPASLVDEQVVPEDVKIIDGFITLNHDSLNNLIDSLGLAMDLEDIKFCQNYFRNEEKRNPTMTEIRILDTYWSDHCRHTTFLTKINNVEFEDGKISKNIEKTYKDYLESREFVYGDRLSKKDICLMDIATVAMKELKKKGELDGFDESEEINACSIKVKVSINGKDEDWLVMFKNETHNHPTEIEPFGGAATCLGGAIRDPLSGRAYVYQAMRVTGAGDPRKPIDQTLEGKLPQRKITTEAAHGYSSYGNQIGLSTGLVDEIYHPGYVAKRMEVGAVIAAAPQRNVVRERPEPGDVVILLGGKTGRDGCGGATGSSKAHDEESIISCGAEVQKGNAPEERKIQRLFRDSNVTRLIKRCNDFGAGGVSVAIGELADGLEINLDKVPKKYDGLDGTELAISESQERMACVVDAKDAESFISAAKRENLECSIVAEVKENKRVKMVWRGKTIVDISRSFLDSNGSTKNTEIKVKEPEKFPLADKPFKNVKETLINVLSDINVASKKGLVERFDNCVGAGTVNFPFGGKYQLTPLQSMMAKIPTIDEETSTGSIMSYGYNPVISSWSPYHGAIYAVIESVSKIVSSGGNYKNIWFSFQEYFERLNDEKERWGKPFAALLGAFHAQKQLGRVAIGGKDSMSGSFKDLDVPPTLISFAVDVTNLNNAISPEFKEVGSSVIYFPIEKDENYLPDFESLKKMYEFIQNMVLSGEVKSAYTVGEHGVAEAISKMCFGNKIGFQLNENFEINKLFSTDFGGIVIELSNDIEKNPDSNEIKFFNLGKTVSESSIKFGDEVISLDEAINNWETPLEVIFPTKVAINRTADDKYIYNAQSKAKAKLKIAKPRVLIPSFPGTNSEYDSLKAFNQAGAISEIVPIRNLTPQMINETINELAEKINNSQIVFIPGGFSAGDEPEGSGKFIAAIFRNRIISDAINNLLKNRDGLVLGICNGFQALIKLGLVPYGEIREIEEETPTLTFNKIGRHVSKIVYTKVVSNLSPWFANVDLESIQAIPISHGEGRFVANDNWLEKLKANGQIITQYVDFNGKPTMDNFFNPNSSFDAVEGITSPDGRVLGKMGHNERLGNFVGQNIPGDKEIKLFRAGVEYFL